MKAGTFFSSVGSYLWGESADSAPTSATQASRERRPTLDQFLPASRTNTAAQYSICQGISNLLPRFSQNEATIIHTDDERVSLRYTPSPTSTPELHSFPSDELMEHWLVNYPNVDVWKVVDRRKEVSRTSYFYADDELHEFASREEALDYLASEYGKLLRLDDLVEETTLHLEAKKGWFRAYWEECPFFDLINQADRLEVMGPIDREWRCQPQVLESTASPVTQKVEALGLSLLLLPISPLASLFAGGIGMLSVAQSQGLTLVNPIPDQITNPGQMFNFTLRPYEYFDDSAHNVIGLNITSNGSSLPPWLAQARTLPLIGSVQTIQSVFQVAGDASHVYASTLPEILTIDFSDFSNVAMVGTFPIASALPFAVLGNILYATESGANPVTHAIDVTDPTALAILDSTANQFCCGFAADGNRIYVGSGSGLGIRIANTSDPANLQEINTISTGGNGVQRLSIQNTNLFTLEANASSTNFGIFDVSNPLNVSRVSFGNPSSISLTALDTQGTYAYFIDNPSLVIYDVSNANNPTFAASLPLGANGLLYVSGNYALVLGTNNQILNIVDIRDPLNPILDESVLISTVTNAVDFTGFNNFLFSTIGGPNRVQIHEIQWQLSGLPQREDRGTYPITVVASNGFTNVTTSFNVIVQNNSPIVTGAPLPSETVDAGVPLVVPIDAARYSDPDGDPLTFMAGLAAGPLPNWLLFDNNTLTFSGTPTSNDVGTLPVNVIADDGVGGNVTDPLSIIVTENTESSSSGSSSAVGVAVGGTIGSICGVILIGGLIFIVWKKTRPEEFEHEPTIAGGYTPVNDDEETRRRVFDQTGYIMPESSKRDAGKFGEIIVVEKGGKFYAAKWIKGKANIEASEREAAIQRDAAGPNVVAIRATQKAGLHDEIYHIMDLYAFNGLDAAARLQRVANPQVKELIGKILARDILTGLQTIHSKPEFIRHLDIKAANVLIDIKKGSCRITDLGCGKRERVPDGDAVGDMTHFSEKRLEAWRNKTQFDGAEADKWAAWIAIVHVITGQSPVSFLNLPSLPMPAGPLSAADKKQRRKALVEGYYRLSADHLNKALAEFAPLRDAAKGSVLALAREGLNPVAPISLDEALRDACFKDLPAKKEIQQAFAYIASAPPWSSPQQSPGSYIDIPGTPAAPSSSAIGSPTASVELTLLPPVASTSSAPQSGGPYVTFSPGPAPPEGGAPYLEPVYSRDRDEARFVGGGAPAEFYPTGGSPNADAV